MTLKWHFKFQRLKKSLLLNPAHQLHCVWVIEFSQLRKLIHHFWPELKLKTKQNKTKSTPHPQLALRSNEAGESTCPRRQHVAAAAPAPQGELSGD